MTTNKSLATAIRTVRKARGLRQEAFSVVSSRTYLSALERGPKNPTLNKLTALCEIMDIHLLTLMTLAYADNDLTKTDQLLLLVRQELDAIADTTGASRPHWRKHA